MGKRAYPLYLALRLLWPRSGAQRLITLVCVGGIALGFMLQIVVRGVMDGMVREIDTGVKACLPELVIEAWPHSVAQISAQEGINHAYPCQIGVGITRHGVCRYSTSPPTAHLLNLLISGRSARQQGEAILSNSFAEKANLQTGDTLTLQLPKHSHILNIVGIFRIPGRMPGPDILAAHPLAGGSNAIAVRINSGANLVSIMQNLRREAPQAKLHPTNTETQGWLSIIQRAKQVMSFIIYLCIIIAAFAAGALLRVICLQHRQQFCIMAAYGMPPSQLRLIILYMAGIMLLCGISIGIPLAQAILTWREEVRQILLLFGIDAFPVEIMDMPLPAVTTYEMYLSTSLLTAGFTLIATMPALSQITKLQNPR